MATAKISVIDRFRCGIDGVGIRTLVCFSGCPLRCKYCPNKFTYSKSFNHREYTAEELVGKIRFDKLYFDATGGGVTFGGGEPLLHHEFINEFIRLWALPPVQNPQAYDLRDNFVIETSLSISHENFRSFLERLSKLTHAHYSKVVFCVDVKTLNPIEYFRYTQKSICNLKKNLSYLKKYEQENDFTEVLIRVPEIDGYVSEKSCQNTVKKLSRLGFNKIDRFKYIKR